MSKKPLYSGAALRELREQREAYLNSPAGEAHRREESFLKNLSNAQDDYEWLVANEAWALLGHESFAAWWEARVQPLMRALSMRPTRELARDAADRIRVEEADLPSSMRRREREIAEMVGATPDELRARQSRSSLVGIPAKDDLVDPVDSIPDAAKQAIADKLAERASGLVGTSPVDESGEDHPAPTLGDAADVAGARDLGDETGEKEEPPVASLPVDEPEPSGAGVSRSAPATPIPGWLVALTAVNSSIHDLTDLDAASIGAVIPDGLLDELGLAYSKLGIWYSAALKRREQTQA